MNVTYEWDIETVDPETGDILDHDFNDYLDPLLPEFSPGDPTMELVLVRHTNHPIDGEVERLWAYVVDGHLPEFFSDSYAETQTRVPARFHRMLTSIRGWPGNWKAN